MLMVNFLSASNVSSDVSAERIISTSLEIGTGEKKWRPPKLDLRFSGLAISPISNEDVFDTRIACDGACYMLITICYCCCCNNNTI